MKIGDLVKYRSDDWSDWIGIVVREIPGTDEMRQVFWPRMHGAAKTACYPKMALEVVSESR